MSQPNESDSSLLYWRGMVDAELSNMDQRVNSIEQAALRVNMENSSKLDHLHACIEHISIENTKKLDFIRASLEKKSAALNRLIGALAALAIFFQILVPLLLKMLIK